METKEELEDCFHILEEVNFLKVEILSILLFKLNHFNFNYSKYFLLNSIFYLDKIL